MITVTADSGANLKLLKEIAAQKLIKVHVISLENGSGNKIKEKLAPVMVWDVSKWGDGSVMAAEDNVFNEILEVVGNGNVQDARHLEAHYRAGNDYFVTEDHDDIISKKNKLFDQFSIKVVTSDELDMLARAEND